MAKRTNWKKRAIIAEARLDETHMKLQMKEEQLERVQEHIAGFVIGSQMANLAAQELRGWLDRRNRELGLKCPQKKT